MMVTVYGCILALSWFGAKMIVVNELTTGELVSLFSYIMNIMISLMMISMAFVMITMARASAERIAEVLNEKSDLTNPENPVMELKMVILISIMFLLNIVIKQRNMFYKVLMFILNQVKL